MVEHTKEKRRFVYRRRFTSLPETHGEVGEVLLRPVECQDAQRLSELMLDAYRDTIDYAGEEYQDCLDEVERLFDGQYGALRLAESFVLETNGELISAALVTDYAPLGGPLLAFIITRKSSQRHGYARKLLSRTVSALAKADESELAAVVTEGNLASESLLTGLGFIREE